MDRKDQLAHYGVIGMKWGMRKAYAKGKDYTYKSHGQRKHEKRVNKITAKAEKKAAKGKRLSYSDDRKLKVSKEKLSAYQKRDKNREDYARQTSVGKSVVKTIAFGPLGAGNYNRLRSSGHGRVVSALGSNYVASTLGYPLTYAITRSSELRYAKR